MFIFLKWYYAHLNLRNERRWAEMTEEERALEERLAESKGNKSVTFRFTT